MAAGYAATRDDGVGDVARKVGESTIQGVSTARAFDKRHGVSFPIRY